MTTTGKGVSSSIAVDNFGSLRWVKLNVPMRPEDRSELENWKREKKRKRHDVKVFDLVPAALCVSVGPRGSFVAVGHEDGFTNVWDLHTIPTVVRALSSTDPAHAGKLKDKKRTVEPVRALHWSRDGWWLIVRHDTHLAVWDLRKPAFVGPARAFTIPKSIRLGALTTLPRTDSSWIAFVAVGSRTSNKSRTASATRLYRLDLFDLSASDALEGGTEIATTTTTTSVTADDGTLSDPIVAVFTVDRCVVGEIGNAEAKTLGVSAAVIDDDHTNLTILVVRASTTLAFLCPHTFETLRVARNTAACVAKKKKKKRAISLLANSATLDPKGRFLVICSTTFVTLHDLSTPGCGVVHKFEDLVSRVKFGEAHMRRDCIVGVSQSVSSANGSRAAFVWSQTVAGHIQYLKSPSTHGLRTVAFFPPTKTGARYLVALTPRPPGRNAIVRENDGAVFLLTAPPPSQTWFGPFFSPRFTLLTENEEYVEKETEFDDEKEGTKVTPPTATTDDALVDHFLVDSKSPVEIARERRCFSVDTLFHRDFLGHDETNEDAGTVGGRSVDAALFPALYGGR
eukprot:g5219.t1